VNISKILLRPLVTEKTSAQMHPDDVAALWGD